MATEYLIEYGQPVTVNYVQPLAVGSIDVAFSDHTYGDALHSETGISTLVAGTYQIQYPGSINNVDRLVDMTISYTHTIDGPSEESFVVRFRRPYATATKIASALGLTITPTPSTSDQITQAKLEQYEAYASARINALTVTEFNSRFVRNRFYGYGSRTLPLDANIVSVEKVLREDELSYDKANSLYPDGLIYSPGPGGTSLLIDHYDGSDIISSPDVYPTFDDSATYTIDYVSGYKDVPLAIEQATILLVNDYRCNDYGLKNHYVIKNDSQFGKTEYDMRVFNGTGNVSIDQLISEYVRIPMRVI